ncbi:hypothetical protein [Sphingomonas oryzagri]|uniref:Pilus assembly protein n=1 Tax=Sphingomonas oryzagri TaxID=3042314 RepID=A0ABT6MWA5_9SPHN|nr:hypothetical protein [Sphingomonas oryzagri]MDH7637319.1 hypothetical protein [Sphingomonas oryzagri]
MIGASNARLAFAKRFLRDAGAVAAAEMALIFPILGYVSLNVMDLGVYIFSRMQTELAAEAAAGAARNICVAAGKYPATYPAGNCDANLTTKLTAAAQATTLGTNVTIVGSPGEGYYCANTAGTLVSVAAVSATPPANCSSVVTGSTTAPGDYINVTTSYTYTPFAPGLAITAALPATIQQTAWMRLK